MTRTIGGRYRIVESLGGGGTSLVYRAEPIGGGGEVAIKELRPQFAADPSLRRRFLREAELARSLDHPGIVRLLDTGEDQGAPFLVLELVRGETLRQRLDRNGVLHHETAWPIFVALARALDHAHSRGVIHRDVKPQNVFVGEAGVKLADFGNARVASLASVTGASLTWGTPEYVAPEMFMRGRADPRSDLYALGVVLYEMLTGRLPWTRAETLTRLGGRAGATPDFAPTGVVDDLLKELLAFSPADRPASGEEILLRAEHPGALAVVAKTRCPTCGAPRPDDVPRCVSCGQEVLRFAHDPQGRWRLILDDLEDDAAATENLLRLLDPLVKPVKRPLHFLTGPRRLHSEHERKSGIGLPVVLFSQLDQSTAAELEALFRRNGLTVHTVEGTTATRAAKPGVGFRPRETVPQALILAVPAVLGGLSLGHLHRSSPLGWSMGAVWLGLTGGLLGLEALRQRWRHRRTRGLVRLRGRPAEIPAADHLLADAAGAVAQIRAPEVRTLLGDVAVEMYRLTRRAGELGARAPAASSEADLVQRTIAAAPALTARLHRIAAHLDSLDAALEGTSEGELMQSLARLERASAAPGADRDALTVARGDLEATLERRHAVEQERARLSSQLCRLLGRLRQEYRRVYSLETPDEQEARAVEAASAELEAFLRTADGAPSTTPARAIDP